MQNNNPWNKKKQQSLNLDQLIDKGVKSLLEFLSGKGKPPVDNGGGDQPPKKQNGGFLFLIIILFLAVIGGMNSFFQIDPGEQGVVLRLGKYNRTASSGLNFKMPLVENVIKVDVENVRKEEFGFRSQQTAYGRAASKTFNIESLMLTGDKNVINLNWVVQYKIRDPENYLFNIRNVRQTIRDISESVIRRLIGNRDFDYVLDQREELALSTRMEMQELLDKYNSGIQLVTVQLQNVNPPDPVRPSFNEVNEADQDMRRLVNEAQKIYNDKIPKAKGTAKQMIEEAKGYATQRVNNAKGDVSRFSSIYKEYKGAKQVTRIRMYLETMKSVIPGLDEVYIVDENQKNMVPLLNMGANRNFNSISAK